MNCYSGQFSPGPPIRFPGWSSPTSFDDCGTQADSTRAEFIRLQCAVAQLPDSHPERVRLTQQAATLFREHGWSWYGRSSRPAGWAARWHDLFGQYDRGLLTELRIPGRLAHLAADLTGLFAAEPVGTVAFECAGARADHFRAARRLAVPPRPVRLAFRLASHTGDPVGYFAAVVNSFLATAVVAIDAAGFGGLGVVLALARSPFLTNLRELVLDAGWRSSAGVDLLATSPRFASLERLTLRGSEPWPSNLDVLRARFGERLVV